MVINPIVGVYIPIIRIPNKGGMTIPNIATFDHGTHDLFDQAIHHAASTGRLLVWWSWVATKRRQNAAWDRPNGYVLVPLPFQTGPVIQHDITWSI